MNLLADTWILWLVLALVVAGMMVFYRESRRNSGPSTPAGIASQDEFSVKTILFGFRRGEGDLFVGYLAVIVFFSMFLAGFIRWIQRLV